MHACRGRARDDRLERRGIGQIIVSERRHQDARDAAQRRG
jgi:hypothetical protein